MTMADETESVQGWLARLRSRLGADGLELSSDEQSALLDLARIAAHRSHRIAAPLSTFLVGVALGARSSEERAATLAAIIRDLDQPGQTPDSESPQRG